MEVRVASVTRKDGGCTQGQNAVGREGTATLSEKNLVIIMNDGYLLRTSRVEKITVETKNSIYKLEAINEEEK